MASDWADDFVRRVEHSTATADCFSERCKVRQELVAELLARLGGAGRVPVPVEIVERIAYWLECESMSPNDSYGRDAAVLRALLGIALPAAPAEGGG